MITPHQWSGTTTAYEHKHNPTAELPPGTQQGVRKVWLLDAQWSTCPKEVENEVRELWREFELGNDNRVINTTIVGLREMVEETEREISTSLIIQYLTEMGVGENEQVMIYWWW